MSTQTPNLDLFKWNPSTDGENEFNIDTALNQNWDKLDITVLVKTGYARNLARSRY